ncbi:MAG: hypothetical protein H6Q11_582, partial [Acidobacteria bacterium]|nr:hypothetical protein [Acidobacteriota bacterium]
MPRRTPLWLAVALLAATLAAPGSAAAASGLTLTVAANPVDEGTPVEVIATFDPAGGAPDRFRFVWGDGTSSLIAAPPVPPYEVPASHVYADEGTGAYDVRVGVTVPGQDGVSRGLTLAVSNAPPVLDLLPPLLAPLGQPFGLTVGFSDPGASDVHQVTVAWGDGASDVLAGVTGGAAQFSHTYAVAGPFTVTVTVDDGEGGVAAADFVATVVPYCGGLPVTIDAAALPAGEPIFGTADADAILGTPGPDVIDARGGNDAVCGGGGNDT